MVLPVYGCATIRPRWPFPIGVNISITLTDRDPSPGWQRVNFSSGKRGVRKSKGTLSLIKSGLLPLISSTLIRGKYFSPSFGGRIDPLIVSPVLRPYNFICDWETYISSGELR